MNLAFVYAGQGSQKKGMGKDFYENFQSVRNIFDNAPVDFDIKEMCFEDPNDLLSKTRYTQPCMVAFAAAVTQILINELKIVPKAAAGLSLGEYSALCASGVMDAKTAISLTAYRGKIMEETTSGLESKMVAILGLGYEDVKKAVIMADGEVDIANLNCTGQIVIGGEKEAVDRASQFAKELGAKRTLALNVSGPFHTRFMEKASVLLKNHLEEIKFNKPNFKIYYNLTGGDLEEGMNIKEALCAQIKSPVKFETIIKNMEKDGIDTVLEIGPGKVLSGFIKKTAAGIKTISIETIEELHIAKEILFNLR